ncbi:MAG: DUF1854 domain-containing protein [Isosphaeraceae bacterium]
MSDPNGQSHDFRLERDDFGRLVLTDAEGQRSVGVEPVRAFPITDPARNVAIVDAEGRELVLIADLDALPADLRATLDREFARREFIPVISRIRKVHGESHPTEWDVRTDRGAVKFTVNSDDDIRHMGPNRALIVDSQGVRYLIDDIAGLDAASKRILEVWL